LGWPWVGEFEVAIRVEIKTHRGTFDVAIDDYT
jgi:hypothetical protein